MLTIGGGKEGGVCEPTVYVGGSMKVGKFLIDGVNFCAPFVESGLLGGRFAGVGCGHWRGGSIG